MSESCLQKQQHLKEEFSKCLTSEAKYEKIIELGRLQKPLDASFQTPERIVAGCQSKMYLRSYLENDRVIFEAESDALISAGLGVLLTQVYSGETPETVLKCPPDYIKEIGLDTSLSPGRSNGLYSLHLKMKQDALALIAQCEKK
jgi:cysteine desulfuration protein SufE